MKDVAFHKTVLLKFVLKLSFVVVFFQGKGNYYPDKKIAWTLHQSFEEQTG